MFEFRAWIIRIVLLLLPVQYCFAATIYVNVNNPTPGTGATWASAYKDLSLALAAASYGDQVWVAQGTYKPTATTDRTISFLLNAGVLLYGGFTGVESTLGARNWTTNVTILSGDIGVVGDASDNSYNVVTITNNHSSATLDGFTIRDGNANMNYPASTTIQPYNQGGGVLAYAGVNGYVGAEIDHCILTANFAVYGAGLCTYANGSGSVIEVNLLGDLFLNNTSVMGGGMAYVSMNGGAGLTQVASCIFNGNTSSGGSGSAIAGLGDANSALCSLLLYYNTFYNNPAPVLNKVVQNGGTMNFNASDFIVWQASGVYGSPVITGGVTYYNGDIDVASPGSGYTNVDPQFVNAAGGDFHLQPCSPDIDAGGYDNPSPNVDYDGNPRMQNNSVDYGAYESSKTISTAPFATSPPAYCQYVSASALSATGSGLLWYTVATGGVGDPAAPVPSTAAVGATQYWVTQTIAGQCESNRTLVTVHVNASPAAPVAPSPPAYCQNAAATALTATGTGLLWYTVASGGVGSSAAPVPSTVAFGSTTWYVSQTSGCESPRTPVVVTVNALPAAPGAPSPPAYCQNATAAALTATGTGLLWYTVSSGGVGASAAPVPSTTAFGSTTWYVSQTNGCESPRTPVVVTVNATPVAPGASSPVVYCQNATASALTATGTGLLWYTAATGGVGASAAPVPSTAAFGSTTWYVSQTNGCESPRTPVVVTVNATPAAPVAEPVAYCQDSTASALSATGTGLLWYTAATGGVGVSIAPEPSTAVDGTTTWYVSQTNGCESPRTAVVVTVNVCPGPPPPIGPPPPVASPPPVAPPPPSAPSTLSGYSIPSAFTPNGDGHNDLFRVRTGDVPRSFKMLIFNRFGGKVFESANIDAGWNGNIGNNLASPGTYVYVIAITTSAGGVIERRGTVEVIR